MLSVFRNWNGHKWWSQGLGWQGGVKMVRVRWLAGIGVVCLLAAAGTYVVLSQAERPKTGKRISLESSSLEPPVFPRSAGKLRIAVAAIISPAKSLIFYQDMFDYIGEKLGREVEMVQRKTYAEVNFLLREGLIDAAFVCSPPVRP